MPERGGEPVAVLIHSRRKHASEHFREFVGGNHIKKHLFRALRFLYRAALEEYHRLEGQSVFFRHVPSVLIERQRSENALLERRVRLDEKDVLGVTFPPEILETVVVEHFSAVLVPDVRVAFVERRGELEKHVIGERLEHVGDARLPRAAFEFPVLVESRLFLVFRRDVEVMRLVADETCLPSVHLSGREAELLRRPCVRPDFLERTEDDVDVVGRRVVEGIALDDVHKSSVDDDALGELVFRTRGIDEVAPSLGKDAVAVNEKDEIPVAFLVEKEHQRGHDERLAAPRRHVEEPVLRIKRLRHVPNVDEAPYRLALVRSERERGVETG